MEAILISCLLALGVVPLAERFSRSRFGPRGSRRGQSSGGALLPSPGGRQSPHSTLHDPGYLSRLLEAEVGNAGEGDAGPRS